QADSDPDVRLNPIGIQMLSPNLQKAVFPRPRYPEPRPVQTALAIEHLEQQGIWGQPISTTPPVDLPLPELEGATIQDHFYHLGRQAAEPYLGYAKRAMRSELPPMPTEWCADRSGWMRYAPGRVPEPVAAPADGILVFDVEVLFRQSPYPLIACAASPDAWYMWVSPHVLDPAVSDAHLIPLGTDPSQPPSPTSASQPRIIIGHNVGFDRVRVANEYTLKESPNVYLDTMSFHCAVSGLSNQQRMDWMYYKKLVTEYGDSQPVAEGSTAWTRKRERRRLDDLARMSEVGSMNSLKEVARLHCGIEMDKDPRDIFMNGTVADVKANFQYLATYCARDVETTHRVFQKVFPKYLQKCPHPASFAGMTEMIGAVLPVTDKWDRFVASAEARFLEMSQRIEAKLVDLAELALDQAETAQHDPWLCHLDWQVAPIRMTKAKYLKDGQFATGGEPRPHSRQFLPGKPAWLKSVWDRSNDTIRVTSRTRITPYLLKLKWRGYPLYFSDQYGWTFRIPRANRDQISDKPLAFPTDPLDPQYETYPAGDTEGCFFRIPHQDGENARCLNPLAKGYVSAFEDGILTSEYEAAREALQMSAQCSYWISCRERVKSQLVIWDRSLPGRPRPSGTPPFSHSPQADSSLDGPRQGLLLPQVVPMGTVTRRAVESTWMTASNAKPNRIGSELKSIVEAPPGYCLVGADVDSEELWISSLIGDAQFRAHGATALGWMNLQGTKAAGTDMHSNTAQIMGISRNHAKIFNYGRIYGAGVKFATQLLLKFNPTASPDQARETALKLYKATKGHQWQAPESFRGGSESFMFNALEAVAVTDSPRTPALGCEITDTLLPQVAGTKYMTSRINWVVQSSGVDYLHLLIVSMRYLCRRYQIDARFLISIHDEIRYLVAEPDRYRAALALQIANLWTRALFSYRLGMENLPLSVAFFSSVDVDHVLRKEVDLPCVTPSHPDTIPPGESLTIQDLVSK
ncbi:DNA polymerase family A-domain-containing protein, partial [Dimargaris cristalligena]